MAESEMIVGELASFCCGSLRLRDSDILVVQSNKVVSTQSMAAMRADIEAELVRLGINEPKVLALPFEVNLSVIGRS